MKAYRYNSKNRQDRKFNNTGREKNPNALKFYGKTLEYCENYRFILDENNDVVYECELEVVETGNTNLFDMVKNFEQLNTFQVYFQNHLNVIEANNAWSLRVEKKKPKKVNLKKEYQNAKCSASSFDFQSLSDYEMQNILVSELKALGFDGYETSNEIVLF